MKIMLIMAGAVTGALLTVLLLAGAAFVRAGECMRAMEWRKNGLRRAWDNPCPA